MSPLEERIHGALDQAQKAQGALDASTKILAAQLRPAIDLLIKPGDVIDRSTFGPIAIAGGNARGATRFEIAEKARLHNLKPDYPELTQILVAAWPLNDAGKRMSGRSGNSRTRAVETVTLSMYLCGRAMDDNRDGTSILMDVIAKAAAVKSVA